MAVSYTTTYNLTKPEVGASEDEWGGLLNTNFDNIDNLLDGTTPITGIDINSGTIDGAVIGGATPAAITGTAITGTSFATSGDFTFGDNDKAIFGAGSDLQIYSDGTNSWIEEHGGGDLYIEATNLTLRALDNTVYATFTDAGASAIYHAGAQKLTTTATGIDVTGTAVTDGLTVAGNVSVDGGTIKLDGNYPVGTDNVALGDTALDSGSLSGGWNVAVGTNALTANTTGNQNVAVGSNAADGITTGANNVSIGRETMGGVTTGDANTVVGSYAMYSAGTDPDYNTAIGNSALAFNQADNNTAVGYQAGYSNTTGANNVAIGRLALYAATTASFNTAVGSLAADALTTGANNTAIGLQALTTATTSDNNTAVGFQSLFANTTASSNTAVGYQALYANTTGSVNVAIGFSAGKSNTTGSSSVIVGDEAGFANTTSVSNVYVGRQSGYYATGGENTFVGNSSGVFVSSGQKNTILGRYNGNQGGLDIRTASNNIVLSDGDGVPYVAIGPFNSAVEDRVNTGSYDTFVLGRVGSDAVRASGVVIGDVFGANYLIGCGGYGLTFAKAVATDGNTTPTSYANALQILASGTTDTTPDVHINNTLSKGSGSFRIEHPLPSKSETHDLVHSFIEGPKADLIYRGKVDLVNGTASVNIDTESTMTTGTFEVLCRDVQCFTSNETGWTAVKGSVTGNVLTIVAQENTCTDTISWMVVGERKDPKMRSSSLTDDDGNMIVEPLKRVESVIDYENA